MLNVVFLGPPGSGKGTQAESLCQATGVRHLATGDLFRTNLKNRTDVGKLAAAYMNRGELVPDKVTVRMVREWLADHRGEVLAGILFDGLPRSSEQARALEALLAGGNQALTAAVYLDVGEDAIVERLSGRLICRKCQVPFNRTFQPFVTCPTGECESGEYLYQRDDDRASTVLTRLETFHQETAPVIDFYVRAGLLRKVDGEGTVNEVKARVLATIEDIQVGLAG